MSEYEINERRHWKAMTFPYDIFIPDNSEECQYCLTDKQAEYLRGLLEPAGWSTRWWSDTTEVDQDKIEQFRDDLIRRLMMSCCGDEAPIQYRYSEDGVLQQSTDDGTTWQDVPEKDPRNYSPLFPDPPTVEGEDKKCVAVDGMITLLKEQVTNQLTDDMSRYTLGQLITDWVKSYIETSNPFLALLTVITNQIFALVIATLRPAITDEAYDALKCCLYDNIESDITFSESDVDAVRACITGNISGIAGVFFEHLVYLLGSRGMTNLARAGAGASDADCSGCGNTCPITWDTTDGLGTIIDVGSNYVTVESTFQTSPFAYNMVRLRPGVFADNCCIITGFEVLSGDEGFGQFGTAEFPTGPNSDPSFPSEFCWLQFEKDGAEAPFTVKITFG